MSSRDKNEIIDTLPTEYPQAPAKIQTLFQANEIAEIHIGCSSARVYSIAEQELVFTHGDYCLPNILLQGKRISGFIDLDRAGIADQYNDLAIASRSIAYNLGTDYGQRFFIAYGVENVDKEKSDLKGYGITLTIELNFNVQKNLDCNV